MSLENNPLTDGSAKVNEEKLNGSKVTVTVKISKKKTFMDRLKGKFEHIHFDKPHLKLFAMHYALHIASIVQSSVSILTLCFFNPNLSTRFNKMIAVHSYDVTKARKEYAAKKEEEEKAKVDGETPAEKKEAEKTEDELMEDFIAKLKDKTIYDTFGNPIKQ